MRATAASAILVLLLTGCGEPSNVDPDAAVTVTGAAQHLDGTPVTSGTAMVLKDIGIDDFAASAPVFFGTMGMACLAGTDLDLCDEEGVRTDLSGDGTFTLTLRGRDVQSGFGTTSTLWATVAADGSQGLAGPSTASAFTAQSETVNLPPLRLWEPAVDVIESRGKLRVQWPALPRRLGRHATYQARIESASGDLVWSMDRAGVAVDARVLEDVEGAVSVEASVDESGRRGAATYRSAQQRLSGPGAPASRGAPCSAVATGRRSVAYHPCPLTDGVFNEDFDPALDPECAEKTCPRHDTAVVVDLGEVRQLSLVVVRAEPDVLVLSISNDGRRWRRLSTVAMKSPNAAVSVPDDTRARYLRLHAQRWPLPTLRELSAW